MFDDSRRGEPAMILPTVAALAAFALVAGVLFQRHRRRQHLSCMVAHMLQAQSL